jgi:A/G-specific adenine glycosylase
LFTQDAAQAASPKFICSLPTRQHPVTYHRPLLLHPSTGPKGQGSLLDWFDGVSSARSMPWRKPWIKPDDVTDPDVLRAKLERRAYEVWISEIMLQQTRVATVIDYWNRWMEKWPTIHDLAAADPDDVLAAWRGLGYYSRATRIHEAAKHVVKHPRMEGLLPEDAKSLEAEVPGVGRYTAGAISSIVFGRPEPMVDGNVLRVLSRQLGLLGNVKTDKSIIDVLWAAADALVKDVARGTEHDGTTANDIPKSDRPGRWGQALMELGSTVCTPRPDCGACPITFTCRAYQEGQRLASSNSKSRIAAQSPIGGVEMDIEDACGLCEPFENVLDQDDKGKSQDVAAKLVKPARPQQATLASFAFTRQANAKATPKSEDAKRPSQSQLEIVANHAKRFPLKIIKKAVREEETLVCAIRRGDGTYLVHRRPEKGLLAGLWEFPSRILDATEFSDARRRSSVAKSHVSGLLVGEVRYLGELGSVPWLFSHLKLTMHVHMFELEEGTYVGAGAGKDAVQQSRWSDNVDGESMGTGMRKCWSLVKNWEG